MSIACCPPIRYNDARFRKACTQKQQARVTVTLACAFRKKREWLARFMRSAQAARAELEMNGFPVDHKCCLLNIGLKDAPNMRHGVAARVTLLHGDLLEPLPEPVDLLVSNPPYTVLAEIDENVRRHEPHLALDGGADGLSVYRRLLADAPAKLAPRGAVVLEIGATQGAMVAALAQQYFPGAAVTVRKDLARWDRVVEIVTR